MFFEYGKQHWYLRHNWSTLQRRLSAIAELLVLSDNAVVAPAWWRLQVSQGSVKTLFMWGGKRLYTCAANLFWKQCTKFHQNRPNLLEAIRKKNHFGLFISGHIVSVSVCLSDDNFRKPWRRKFIFAHAAYLHGLRVCKGHRVQVKVTGAKRSKIPIPTM